MRLLEAFKEKRLHSSIRWIFYLIGYLISTKQLSRKKDDTYKTSIGTSKQMLTNHLKSTISQVSWAKRL